MTKKKISYTINQTTYDKIVEIFREYNKYLLSVKNKNKVLTESNIAEILIILGYRAIKTHEVSLYAIEEEAKKWMR